MKHVTEMIDEQGETLMVVQSELYGEAERDDLEIG